MFDESKKKLSIMLELMPNCTCDHNLRYLAHFHNDLAILSEIFGWLTPEGLMESSRT